jgi:YbbR domain-containing protein
MIKPLKNWHLKILALLSAIILWLLVVGLDNSIFLFPDELDIQVKNIGSNVSLGTNLPPVKVYIKVEKEIFKTITKNDFDTYVDLVDLTTGEHTVPVVVTPRNSQVVVLKVEPKTVDLFLAPLSEKEVPVEISYSGTPKIGYAIKEITSETKKVKISGAQSALDKISGVKAELVLGGTETVDLNQNVAISIPVIPDLPKESVKSSPEQIVVSAKIVGEIKQKVVSIKPDITGLNDPQLLKDKIVLSPSQVVIQGEEKALKDIESIDTKPVDINILLQKTVPQNLELLLPDKVSLLNPDEKVTIIIKASPDEQKNIFAPIVFTRENKDFTVKGVTPDKIRIAVIGPSSIIKNLKEGDVTVNINLQDVKKADTVLINIKDIIVPQGVSILSFSPEEVAISTI